MILDCVDWRQLDANAGTSAVQNVGNLYDLLYQVYCAKLTPEGSEISQEKQLRSFITDQRKQRKSDSKAFGSRDKGKPWYRDDT